jgi:predicted MFS family arabinose efflux permease
MGEPRQSRWKAFASVLVAAVACAVNQFKVPPVLGDVQARFGMSLSAAGWVSSVYALAILALAVPGAMVIRRLGMRKAALAGILVSAVASLGGAVASSTGVFVVLRVLEGVGQSLLFVIGPTLVSELFSPEERGLPLGVFNCAIPVAVVTAYNVAVPLRDMLGLSSIWVASSLLLCVGFGLVAAFVPAARMPDDEGASSGSVGWSAWKNAGILLCCLAMCGSGFRDLAYATWSPAYYVAKLGMSEAGANLATSMEYVGLVAGSVGLGILVDRFGERRQALTLVFVESLTLLASFFGFMLAPGAVMPYMLFLGLLVGANVTLLYAGIARFSGALEMPMGSAMMTVFLSVGQLLGPPASGALVEMGGWDMASVATVCASAVMVACSVGLSCHEES